MSQRKIRILLIDDEPAFTTMLRLNLEKSGKYLVQEENDSHLALATARSFGPDLIFLDIVMPDVEGDDVASALRSDPHTKMIPIVFLTALVANEEAQIGGLVSGGQRFLPKPASVAEIIGCINRTLELDGSANDEPQAGQADGECAQV